MIPAEFEERQRSKRAVVDAARDLMFDVPHPDALKGLERRIEELNELEKAARNAAEQSTGEERRRWVELGVLNQEQAPATQ